MNEKKPTKYDLWEMLESAKINFENVERMNPSLARHPIYMIAKNQLEEVCRELEKGDEE